jgi:hypothetical protein
MLVFVNLVILFIALLFALYKKCMPVKTGKKPVREEGYDGDTEEEEATNYDGQQMEICRRTWEIEEELIEIEEELIEIGSKSGQYTRKRAEEKARRTRSFPLLLSARPAARAPLLWYKPVLNLSFWSRTRRNFRIAITIGLASKYGLAADVLSLCPKLIGRVKRRRAIQP